MEFVEILSPSALKDLEKGNAELVTMIANMDKLGQKVKGVSTPSGGDSALKNMNEQYIKQQKTLADLQIKLERYSQAQNRTKISNNQLEQSEIRLTKAREQQIKAADREQAKLEAALNLQSKTNLQLKLVENAYNNLALKKARYNSLSDNEEKRLQTLTNTLQKYRTIQDGVNTTVGKFQQRVGNYATAFNPLSNSINQLGREMPAFANSMQTGFMAISNNLPVFFDAMSNVIAQNKELQAQGKPTQSVLSQLAGSLFSFQTLLSVGVTLLTVYGKEIINWVSSLWGASEALDELNKNQKDFNKTRVQGKKDSQEDILNLRKYLAVAKDVTASEDFRNEAVKKLREQYYYYFKNLTDAQIKSGQYGQAVKDLTKALERKGQIELATSLNVSNKQRLIDLEEEIKLTDKSILAKKRAYDIELSKPIINDRATAQAQRIKLKKAEDEYNLSIEQRNKLNEEVLTYQNAIAKNDEIIFQLKKQTIALEIQEDKEEKKRNKTRREKLELSFKEVESEYNLRKAILERIKAETSSVMNDETKFLNDRLKAREEFSKASFELVQLEADKEKAILTLKYKEDVDKNNLALKNKDISYRQYIENLTDINKRFNNEIGTLDIYTSINYQEIVNEDAKFYKKIQDEKRKYAEDTNNLILKSEQNKFKKIADDEKLLLKVREQAHNSFVNASKRELDLAKLRDLANATSDEQIQNIIEKYRQLYQALDDLQTPAEKARLEFEKYLESIGSGKLQSALDSIGISSAKMFLDFDRNGQTTFIKMWELAKTTGEKFAIAFQGIGDVFQDVMSIMNQADEKRYNDRLERLGKERDIAIQFAGDSATAKAEIERQYEERRKQLERQKAQQQKQTAIFNIIIDTAQAVVGALAEQNYAGAILFGVLGAAQLAIVNAQQIPAYEDGTDNHIGGKMLINDQKGSNYVEAVKTPDGKVRTYKGRNVVVDAPKGTQVFTASETAMMFDNNLNSLLSSNNIQPNVIIQNNGVTYEQMDSIMSKHFANMQTNNTTLDKQGFNTFIQKAGQKNIQLQNRVSFKGYSV